MVSVLERNGIYRESIPAREVYGGCDWCGNGATTGVKTLYTYTRPTPFNQNSPYSRRYFCNKQCAEAFYS